MALYKYMKPVASSLPSSDGLLSQTYKGVGKGEGHCTDTVEEEDNQGSLSNTLQLFAVNHSPYFTIHLVIVDGTELSIVTTRF